MSAETFAATAPAPSASSPASRLTCCVPCDRPGTRSERAPANAVRGGVRPRAESAQVSDAELDRRCGARVREQILRGHPPRRGPGRTSVTEARCRTCAPSTGVARCNDASARQREAIRARSGDSVSGPSRACSSAVSTTSCVVAPKWTHRAVSSSSNPQRGHEGNATVPTSHPSACTASRASASICKGGHAAAMAWAAASSSTPAARPGQRRAPARFEHGRDAPRRRRHPTSCEPW